MKRSESRKTLALVCGSLIFFSPAQLLADTGQRGSSAETEINRWASPANVVQYVRDRFQIPPSTKVDAEPMRHSSLPHFYQTLLTLDDGKQKRAMNAFITDDAQCFAFGSVFALVGASEADIIRCLRQAGAIPATAKVSMGALSGTPFRDFLHSTVTIELGAKVEKAELYVTRDRKVGILGTVLPYRRDFVQQLIDIRDQPSVGPAKAPVTIVEYADLECQYCAAFHKYLDTEFLPRYHSQVRIVFKEYPLSFHRWSTTGAVANECAYQIDPGSYFRYRSVIFRNQAAIDPTNVRERLLELGEEVGLNRTTLASCLDSQASRGHIEAARKEAQVLGINGTPTFSVNGRIIVGAPAPSSFNKIVDEALNASTNRR